jgi:D-sedoheptulose 7-phosphate isomerase
MKDTIIRHFGESVRLKKDFLEQNINKICKVTELILLRLSKGNKLLLFGNGGSAADAQHIAAEFVGRFRLNREPLSAVALTTDTSIITSITNDFSYLEIFSRQIKALGKPGDIALGISTSGNSENIVQGLLIGKILGLHAIGITGNTGGKVADVSHIFLNVPSVNTAHVQEVHITLFHVICEIVENCMCT